MINEQKMGQAEKMKMDILEDIDGYLQQLVYLKDLFAVKQDIEKNRGKMQSASNFTLIVECALADSYLLLLMKLYDKSEQAKTIPNLIKKCINNINLFPSKDEALQKLEEFEKKLKEDLYIPYTIEVLRMRRDSAHVHNDKRYFGSKLQNDTSVLKRYHIYFLIAFTEEVLDYLFAQLSSNNDIKPIPKYNEDLKNLLEH